MTFSDGGVSLTSIQIHGKNDIDVQSHGARCIYALVGYFLPLLRAECWTYIQRKSPCDGIHLNLLIAGIDVSSVCMHQVPGK